MDLDSGIQRCACDRDICHRETGADEQHPLSRWPKRSVAEGVAYVSAMASDRCCPRWNRGWRIAAGQYDVIGENSLLIAEADKIGSCGVNAMNGVSPGVDALEPDVRWC